MVDRDTQGWPPESTLDAGDADEADASGLSDTPGERWYECARSGQLFRSSETVIEEITGFRVAKDFEDIPDERDPRIRGIGASRLFPGGEEEVTE